LNRCYIKKEVNRLKKKYQSNNPEVIARGEDIEVIYSPLKIWGMYTYMNKNKVIFINSLLSVPEQNIVLKHELGHAILHPKSECFFSDATNYLSKIKVEYEANLFLAEFSIDDIDEFELNGYSIDQIASKFNVPKEIVRLKFNI
jgi:Zn-dependent peptidase ImmA (M78 family)